MVCSTFVIFDSFSVSSRLQVTRWKRTKNTGNTTTHPKKLTKRKWTAGLGRGELSWKMEKKQWCFWYYNWSFFLLVNLVLVCSSDIILVWIKIFKAFWHWGIFRSFRPGTRWKETPSAGSFDVHRCVTRGSTWTRTISPCTSLLVRVTCASSYGSGQRNDVPWRELVLSSHARE